MRRKTFDLLVSMTGVLLTAMLIIAGGLLYWGYSFANDNVKSQLSAQHITFPDKAGIAAQKSAEITKYVTPYAGQQVVNGRQAQVFADHYIAVHLRESGGGLTYAELSNKARANPADTKLADQVQTAFRGETLRGMLLNAYAFWKLGQIALIGSIVSFVLGGVMALLTILGFVHARRTGPEDSVFVGAGREMATS